MGRWRSLVLLVVTGCSFEGKGGAGGTIDAAVADGMPLVDTNPNVDSEPLFDAPASCTMFEPPSGDIDPCLAPPGDDWVVDVDGTYDTDLNTWTGNGPIPTSYIQNGIRVISMSSVRVGAGATLRAVGSLPLIVLSWSTFEVNGTIDVSSTRTNQTMQRLGAGANGTLCDPSPKNGGGNEDSGGGGGGGYRANGGNGGNGGNNGGSGGMKLNANAVTTITGGCPGGNGGTDTDAGDGGAGGGAVRLVARSSIAIGTTGRIHAGGAGGGGAVGDSGGGGGGSGGYIGLDAPTITALVGGILAANGGGGGTGCDGGNGNNGQNGLLAPARATGGAGMGCDNAAGGGRGGALNDEPGEVGANSGESGGGGGGGTGFIFIWGTAANSATTSPPATQR